MQSTAIMRSINKEHYNVQHRHSEVHRVLAQDRAEERAPHPAQVYRDAGACHRRALGMDACERRQGQVDLEERVTTRLVQRT